jgi:hypothetical protein
MHEKQKRKPQEMTQEPSAEIVIDAPVDAVTLNKLIARMRGNRATILSTVREIDRLIEWVDKAKPNQV